MTTGRGTGAGPAGALPEGAAGLRQRGRDLVSRAADPGRTGYEGGDVLRLADGEAPVPPALEAEPRGHALGSLRDRWLVLGHRVAQAVDHPLPLTLVHGWTTWVWCM